ncbi:hypothetical protein GEMRC1_004013 [Eukaryota sp. GEM-RC1]
MDIHEDLSKLLKHRKFSTEFDLAVNELVNHTIDLHKPRLLREALNKLRFVCGSIHMPDIARSLNFHSPYAPLESTIQQVIIRIESLTTTDYSVQIDLFRSCFDVLRNAVPASTIYIDLVSHAYQFCLNHNLVPEFKQFCELFRTHSKPILMGEDEAVHEKNVVVSHIKSRVIQLDYCFKMNQLQEGIRTVQDTCRLVNITKTGSICELFDLKHFLQLVSQIFWVTKNFRFFVYVGIKLANYLEGDELTLLANRVIASSSLSLFSKNSVDLSQKSHDIALGKLFVKILGAPIGNVDYEVFQRVLEKKVLPSADSSGQQFFKYLKNPQSVELFDVAVTLKPFIDFFIGTDMGKELLLFVWTSIFERISMVYSEVSFKKLASILNVSEKDLPQQLLFFLSNSSEIRKTLKFDFISKTAKVSSSSIINHKLADSTEVLNKLSRFSYRIKKSVNLENHNVLYEKVLADQDQEHQAYLTRRRLVTERQQAIEELNEQRQLEHYKQELDRQAEIAKAEEERVRKEQYKREMEREAKKKAEAMKREEKLLQEHQKRIELVKIAEVRDRKLDRMVRHRDWVERAIRREEISMRKAEQERMAADARQKFMEYVEEAKAKHYADWEVAVAEKHRLAAVHDQASELLAKIREDQREAGLLVEEVEEQEEFIEQGEIDEQEAERIREEVMMLKSKSKAAAPTFEQLQQQKEAEEEEYKVAEEGVVEKLDEEAAARNVSEVMAKLMETRKGRALPKAGVTPRVSEPIPYASVVSEGDMFRRPESSLGPMEPEVDVQDEVKALLAKRRQEKEASKLVAPAVPVEVPVVAEKSVEELQAEVLRMRKIQKERAAAAPEFLLLNQLLELPLKWEQLMKVKLRGRKRK